MLANLKQIALLLAAAAVVSCGGDDDATPETAPVPTTVTVADEAAGPMTSAPPTTVAPTSAPPTTVAPTSAPPTTAPPTSAPPTTVAPTSAPPTTAAPTTTLCAEVQVWDTARRGDCGDGVRFIQERLTLIGFPTGVDGRFGQSTENAVKDFQAARGLIADGIVGPNTWEKLVEGGIGD